MAFHTGQQSHARLSCSSVGPITMIGKFHTNGTNLSLLKHTAAAAGILCVKADAMATHKAVCVVSLLVLSKN